MKAEEKHLAAGGGGEAVEEPLFTEGAEEEARPVVPLQGGDAAGLSSMQSRGRLPQSLNLLLAVILAGAAGAAAGYLVSRERAPQPAVQESAETTSEPPAPQATVGNGTDALAVKKDETPSRPEQPAQVEPERPATTTEESRSRDGEAEQVEHGREQAVRDGDDEARPRQEESAARSESQRSRDESQTVRRREEKRIVVRREDERDGRPKARLVGTITGRSRRY